MKAIEITIRLTGVNERLNLADITQEVDNSLRREQHKLDSTIGSFEIVSSTLVQTSTDLSVIIP